MKKKKIYIDRHAIAANKLHGTNKPVVSVRTYKGVEKAHEVEVLGPSRIVYRPEKPLSCGARVWIETDAEILLLTEVQ